MANVSSFSGAMPVIPGGMVELAYVPVTTNVTVSATAAGSGSGLAASNAALSATFVSDGSPLLVEYYCPDAYGTNETDYVVVDFYLDSTYYGYLCGNQAPANGGATIYGARRITPSAGSHTVEVKGWRAGANITMQANTGTTGGSNVYGPAFLRVSKIVNQNDGLKPFWTPPVVTQLPSQATEGDQVLLYSSSPYAGYQTHQYASGSWRTLDDSRGTGAWQTFNPTWTNLTLGTGATNDIYYVVIGKTVVCRMLLKLGTSPSSSGQWEFTLPVSADFSSASNVVPIGVAVVNDNGSNAYQGVIEMYSSTKGQIVLTRTDGTYATRGTVSNTVPFGGVAVNDGVDATFTYEAA